MILIIIANLVRGHTSPKIAVTHLQQIHDIFPMPLISSIEDTVIPLPSIAI
jgi:hypothetical protein